jgi:hypothetical protein
MFRQVIVTFRSEVSWAGETFEVMAETLCKVIQSWFVADESEAHPSCRQAFIVFQPRKLGIIILSESQGRKIRVLGDRENPESFRGYDAADYIASIARTRRYIGGSKQTDKEINN